MQEYVRCKVNYNKKEGCIKLAQLVLIKYFENEFKLDEHGLTPSAPEKTGSVLRKDNGKLLNRKEHAGY
eukprot:5548496-Ditylum_brightwellii.AAC.1